MKTFFITESERKRILSMHKERAKNHYLTEQEDDVSDAESKIENCDEDDDMEMMSCVEDLFGNMTEDEAEDYIMELKSRRPEWLTKFLRWFKRRAHELKKKSQIKSSKGKYKTSTEVTMGVTGVGLYMLVLKYFEDIIKKLKGEDEMDEM